MAGQSLMTVQTTMTFATELKELKEWKNFTLPKTTFSASPKLQPH
jgi:hypothetical protein